MPVLIEQGLEPTLPLNHARIGFDDAPGTYTATSAATNSPAVAAKSWQTFERWRPTTSPATLTKTFDSTQRIDYIGIGAATLSIADTVTVELLLDGTWREVELAKGLGDNPTLSLGFADQEFGIWEPIPDNEAVMILLTPRNGCGGVRVTVEYSGEAPSIGKLAAGEVLTMLRPFYQGHNPGLLAADVTRTPSTSQGGEWLGTTIIRQGRSTQMQWSNLGAGWVRRNLRGLIEHAVKLPFFVAWNPLQFRDCLYAASEGAPQKPTNSGPRDLQSWALDVKAYSDGSEPVTTPLVDREYDEIVTHTRASTGTYFDETGTLRTAAVDEPRFSYDPVTGESLGLLVEGEATNIILQSENFTDPEWENANTAVEGGFVGPDGELSAFSVTSETTDSYLQQGFPSSSQEREITISVFARNPSGEPALLQITKSTSPFTVFKSTPIPPSEGFIRYTATALVPADTGFRYRLRVGGSGVPVGITIIASAAQLEEASTASSYIKATGTPATRAPDVVSVGDAGKWLNSSSLTFILEATLSSAENQSIASLSAEGSTSPSLLWLNISGGNIRLSARTESGSVVSRSTAAVIGAPTKMVVTLDSGDVNFYYQGQKIGGPLSNIDHSAFSRLYFGTLSGSGSPAFPLAFGDSAALPYAMSEAEAIEASKL